VSRSLGGTQDANIIAVMDLRFKQPDEFGGSIEQLVE
jgi:hypothetical protein